MIFNLIPDPQDSRDWMFPFEPDAIIPASRDLRPFCSNIEDQQSVGSCTGNALCSAAEMFLKAGGKFADMSRLFNYYTARQIMGYLYQARDTGSSMRMNLKAARNAGVAKELVWPYNPADWNTEPSVAAKEDAIRFRAGGYFRIDHYGDNMVVTIKQALTKGFPVLVGMNTGTMLIDLKPTDKYLPISQTNQYFGAHEMLIVGYDENHFTLQNSWGASWCDGGFWKCDCNVLVNAVVDLWVMTGFADVDRVAPDVTKYELHEWALANQQAAREWVMGNLGNVQFIIDMAFGKARLTASEFEAVMGLSTGWLKTYAEANTNYNWGSVSWA
jgi:C1A family cysteine protease